ncbi:transglutaminase domain-containing protein [Pseudoflavitalea sp. X16]|uniref:transglutaminase-like domain-containing protein n=1 Tax=Paraflavitalea devenefica TaxID=2716334 RepID=UPI00141E67B5|nr:transglutaminase-like domain-containing protein [Paraflavitalea devenefica]NII26600.1 transglutaminase domain-containing protein [Paraflavitalea devenefica]
MKRLSLVTLVLALLSMSTLAQFQTVDGEGISQSIALKKIQKKAKYGAYLIQKEVSFSTGKGINGQPVATVTEKGTVEMVALESKTNIGYLLPYNQFVKLADYDFEIFYKNNFKSQKYPPQKVSLTDESIFFDDSYGQVYGFLANETGTRCRFKYNYEYSDAKYLTRVFFHHGFPVKQNSISFKVPDWLELEIVEKNFAGYKIKKEVKKEKNVNVYTYTAENLLGIKQEPSSLGRPYYLPHLVITVRSYVANQKKINGFKSLDDMYAWYNFLYKKAENQTDVLKTQVAQLTQGKTTDEDKVKALYYWVQDNIRYIAFEEGYSGFVPQTVQEVFKNKYGDCKGMANLLTEMLKLAGYDAHFAWIGTREIPYDRTEIQSLCVDNHAISVLYLKGKTYFLDGTEKYAALGRNAYRIQGKNVLVQHGDTYKVENVPPPSAEDNQIATQASLVLKGNKISGHVKMTFDGESKNFFHYIYNTIPANKRKEFITHMIELNGANSEATNVKTSDFKNRDIPLVLEGDVEISNQVTQVDKTCYIGIDFFPGTFANFIPDEERQNPIDMDNVFVASDEVTLELPANAKMQAAPSNFQSAFNNNSMEAAYTTAGNKVTLKKKMRMNSPVINTADFTAWKAFLNKIKEFNRNNVTIGLQ